MSWSWRSSASNGIDLECIRSPEVQWTRGRITCAENALHEIIASKETTLRAIVVGGLSIWRWKALGIRWEVTELHEDEYSTEHWELFLRYISLTRDRVVRTREITRHWSSLLSSTFCEWIFGYFFCCNHSSSLFGCPLQTQHLRIAWSCVATLMRCGV